MTLGHWMRKLVRSAVSLSHVGKLSAALFAMAMPAVAHAKSCEQLGRLAMPNVSITAAEVVAAGRYRAPEDQLSRIMIQPGMSPSGRFTMPVNAAFCRVAGTLKPTPDSSIRIEVWLPVAGWKGKFLAIGNFGWAGSLMYAGMLGGLAEGYAVASTDTGHDSATPEGQGGRFALGHPEKLIDYAHRANHLMTVHAKTVIRAFYGKGAARSYWIGCSLGGLQGLIEAKRYPADYDGIVIGAPPNPIVNFNAQQLWPGWLSYHNPDMRIPKAKFAVVHDAVMKACASPIGRKHGFVDQPDTCAFQPSQLLCKGADNGDCLTGPQVRTLEQIYRGPTNPHTGQVIFLGPAKGSEAGFSADGKPFPVALDLFKYAAFENPDWDWTTLDWDKDVAAATAKVGPLMHVDDDLRPFFARGGKLIFYIGWNDGHNPQELIGYYDAVLRKGGPQARNAAKLFAIPGMGHCYGGAGCDTFNKLGTIDQWVDRGVIPERVVAAKVENGSAVRTRPLCAYPRVAKYKGAGDVDDAASFVCSRSSGL